MTAAHTPAAPCAWQCYIITHCARTPKAKEPMRRRCLSLLFALAAAPALAEPVKIVAAENFYGDIAAEIGGADVAVVSILKNPDQDPHLFEASVETAKALADANIAILNGADYDPWM